jgi:peptidoglycan/LPS O-acetylase OafA/YrhL
MIQRIQTLYLLTAGVLMSLMLLLPLAQIAADGTGIYTVHSKGWYIEAGESAELAMATWPVFILALVLVLLPLMNIFLYKNRKLQLRISVYAIILAFGLIGLIYYYFVIGFRQLDEPAYALRFPLVVPVIFIVLIYLAFRGIRKDEILVRSLDRIR